MARLVFRDPNGQDRNVPIGPRQPQVVIGRNADCKIHTTNPSVSRYHAVVSWDGGRYTINEPTGAKRAPTNGTFVNGQRKDFQYAAPLTDGSEIRCGNFVVLLYFDEEDRAPAPAAPDPWSSQQAGGGGWEQQPAQDSWGAAQQPAAADPWSSQQNSWEQQPGQAAPQQPAQQDAWSGSGAGGYQGSSPSSSNYNAPGPTSGLGHGGANPHQSQQNAWGAQPAAPAQPAAVAPASNYGAPTAAPAYGQPAAVAGGASSEEFERVRRELVQAQAVEQRQREQLEQVQYQLSEKERYIADLSRRVTTHDNVVDGLNETIAKLKEQLDLQKEQLRDYRDEIKRANGRAEDINIRYQQVQETMSRGQGDASSLQSQIAELKVAVNQRDRRLEELQRQVDLAQYEAKTERDNFERLNSTLAQTNAQMEQFSRERADLQLVIEQHEATVHDLRRQLEDRDRETALLRDDLTRAQSGGGGGDLAAQLTQVRNQLRAAGDEKRQLEQRLQDAERRAAQAAASGSGVGGDRGEMARQLNQLKRENRDLKMALQDAGSGGGGGGADPRLQQEIDNLRRQLEEARRSGGGGGGPSGAVMDKMRTFYNQLNDAVSGMRNDVQTLQDLFQEIARLVDATKANLDRSRIDRIIEEIDPEFTMEEILNLLSNNQNTVRTLKSSLRDLRELVN